MPNGTYLRITNLDVRAPLAQTSEAEVPIKNLPAELSAATPRRVENDMKEGIVLSMASLEQKEMKKSRQKK